MGDAGQDHHHRESQTCGDSSGKSDFTNIRITCGSLNQLHQNLWKWHPAVRGFEISPRLRIADYRVKANTQHRANSWFSFWGGTALQGDIGKWVFLVITAAGAAAGIKRVWTRDIKNPLHFVGQFFTMINTKSLRHVCACTCMPTYVECGRY